MSEMKDEMIDVAHTLFNRILFPLLVGALVTFVAIKAFRPGQEVDYSWFRSQSRLIQICDSELDAIPSSAPQYPAIVLSRRLAIEEYNNLSSRVRKSDWAADDLPYQIDVSLNADQFGIYHQTIRSVP